MALNIKTLYQFSCIKCCCYEVQYQVETFLLAKPIQHFCNCTLQISKQYIGITFMDELKFCMLYLANLRQLLMFCPKFQCFLSFLYLGHQFSIRLSSPSDNKHLWKHVEHLKWNLLPAFVWVAYFPRPCIN